MLSKVLSRHIRITMFSLFLVLGLTSFFFSNSKALASTWGDTSTMTDADFFSSINLDYPGLSAVKTSVAAGNYTQAKTNLLNYYKGRTSVKFPNQDTSIYPFYAGNPASLTLLNDITNRKFKFGSESYEYPNADVTWNNPAGYSTEFNYNICRLPYVIASARYARDHDDVVQLNNFLDIVAEFIYDKGNANPGYPRTLDTGIRLENLVIAYSIVIGDTGVNANIDAARHIGMLKYMSQSANWLLTNVGSHTGNWVVMESLGLNSMGVYFPEFKNAPTWRDTGKLRLQEQLNNSVYNDGVLNEPAPLYHEGAASQYVRIKTLNDLNGYDVLGNLEDKVLKMVNYSRDISEPGGFQVAIGDSRRDTKNGSFAAEGDYLHRYDLTYVASGGSSGKEPDQTSALYPNAGVAIMRSSWAYDANYMAIENQYAGNHAHPDDLSLTVSAYGKGRLIDPGTYSYDEVPVANWLRKTTEAHSTIEVDDRPQRANGNTTNSWITNDGFDFYSGTTSSNSGYEGEEKPYDFTRKVLFVKPGFWIISDIVKNGTVNSHKYQQTWHFMPNVNPILNTTDGKSKTVVANEPNLLIIPADPAQLTSSLLDGYYSDVDQAYQTAKYASYVKNKSGPAAFDTMLLPQPLGSSLTASVSRYNIGVNQDVASALRFDFSNGVDGFYYISHEANPAAARTFGFYNFDGELSYVQKNADDSNGLAIIKNGKVLKEGVTPLIQSAYAIDNLEVEYNGSTLNLYSSKELNQMITLYAPGVVTITYNGNAITFTSNGDYRTIQADTATALLQPVADAYVRSGAYAGNNYGSESQMDIKNSSGDYNRVGYMVFDLKKLKVNPGTSKLKVTTTAGFSPSGSLKVYGITNFTWSETNLIWDTAPFEKGTLLGEIALSAAATPYELDITHYIQGLNGRYAVLRLEGKEIEKTINIYSKDHATASYRPVLEVQPGSEIVKSIFSNPTDFSATEDATVRGGIYADTNYGQSSVLELKNDSGDYARKAFLKFNIAPYDQSITTAKLSITPISVSAPVTIKLYGIPEDAWKEANAYRWETANYTTDAMTWNTAPTSAGTLIASIPVSQANIPIEIDVTTYVKSHPDKVLSFRLEVDTKNANVSIASKEYGNSSYKPNLILGN
ncbi:heparinase II/III family protein [Paenibacillus oryzisoli]|uniref:CBM96 family carbohydrate-binding protein n=1 Tax=Paenibacillus oryzisoli TaxID=1850517 RepID=UPI003D26547A